MPLKAAPSTSTASAFSGGEGLCDVHHYNTEYRENGDQKEITDDKNPFDYFSHAVPKPTVEKRRENSINQKRQPKQAGQGIAKVEVVHTEQHSGISHEQQPEDQQYDAQQFSVSFLFHKPAPFFLL